MPTYSISAPDGNTYEIQGPAGASDDDVRQEVMRQHPDAGTAKVAAAPAPSQNIFQKAASLTGQAYGRASDAFKSDIAAVNNGSELDKLNPLKIAAPVVDAISAGLSPVKGVADATFGSTPVHLPAKVLGASVPDWMQNINSRGMTGGDIATAALPLAPVVAKGAGAVISAARDAADASPGAGMLSNAKAAISNVTGAQTRAMAATGQMRDATQAALASGQDAATTEAQANAAQAARAQALAQTAKTRAAALMSRSTDAAAQAAPPELAVGNAGQLSDLGDSVRTPALANQADIEDQMKAADAVHRQALNAAADEQAKTGVGAADGPQGQALIAKSQAVVNPSATRPTVGYVPVSGDGTKLHQMVLDTLQPPPEALPQGTTFRDALKLKQQGLQVVKNPDGSYSRVVKPDLESVDNLRRFVGKIAGGDVEGYGAVNKLEAGGLYKDLANVQDEYVGGLSKPVQQNWASAKQALSPFENVRMGQALVGTQNGTDVASVPAANVPGRVISGGRDTLKQAAAVAGQAPVSSMLRSYVQNELSGVSGAGNIANKIAPGTKLGDAVNSDLDLSSAVQDYLSKTQAAEAQGTQAQDLASRATTNSGRADALSKIVDQLQGTSAKAADVASSRARDLANLEIADPKTVGSMYQKMLDQAHADGSIDTDGYAKGLQLAASAQKDFALKATRDKWLRTAAAAMGIGALPMAAHSVLTTMAGK